MWHLVSTSDFLSVRVVAVLSWTDEPFRRALQQLDLNVHIKHSDLTWPVVAVVCFLFSPLTVKHTVLGIQISYVAYLFTILNYVVVVIEREEGIIVINLPNRLLKTHSALEPELGCEPRTYQTYCYYIDIDQVTWYVFGAAIELLFFSFLILASDPLLV